MATVKKSKAGGLQPAKIDWLAARNDYIADVTVSYTDIGKKYGVTKSAVQKRGTAEGWPELRQRLADKAYDAFQHKMLEEKESRQAVQLQHWQNLQALCNLTIQGMANHNFYTDRQGNVILDQRGKPIIVPPSAFALEKLARAMEAAINGERVVLGLPTAVTKSENDINLVNPYDKYGRDQLEMMWESANAIARSRTAPEAELSAGDGAS